MTHLLTTRHPMSEARRQHVHGFFKQERSAFSWLWSRADRASLLGFCLVLGLVVLSPIAIAAIGGN